MVPPRLRPRGRAGRHRAASVQGQPRRCAGGASTWTTRSTGISVDEPACRNPGAQGGSGAASAVRRGSTGSDSGRMDAVPYLPSLDRGSNPCWVSRGACSMRSWRMRSPMLGCSSYMCAAPCRRSGRCRTGGWRPAPSDCACGNGVPRVARPSSQRRKRRLPSRAARRRGEVGTTRGHGKALSSEEERAPDSPGT